MSNNYPVTKSQQRRYRYSTHTENFSGGPSGTWDIIDRSYDVMATDSVTLGASPRGWKHNILVGSNAGSVLTGRRYKITPLSGAVSGIYLPTGPSNKPPKTVNTVGNENPIFSFPIPATSVSILADNKAREALLGDYLKARNNWRGGNFLAEVRETIHMLRHPITSIFGKTQKMVSRVHGIRHVRNRETYRKRLGNIWLAYSFGIKPLIEDIKDVNKAIEALQRSPRFDGISIKGTGSDVSATVGVSTRGFGSTPATMIYSTSSVVSSHCKYYGVVGARPEGLRAVGENFGVDPWDILPAVWEAVPWSFLVDYFVNVQQVLDGMRFASADLKWLMKGVKNSIKNQASSGAFGPYNKTLWALSGGTSGGSTEGLFVARSTVDSLPYPRFRFKIPGLGSMKWVNVAALIAQINGSKPSKS